VALVLLGAAAVMVGVVWTADNQSHKSVVARNVTLVDRPVGGLDRPAVAAVVADLSSSYAGAEVDIRAPSGGFKANATELGLTVDQARTTDAAFQAGDQGFVLARVWNWAKSFVASRPAPVVVSVDQGPVRRLVAQLDKDRVPAVEPTITAKDGAMVAVPGKDGTGIDPVAVITGLSKAAAKGLPLVVTVGRTSVPPQFGLAEAEKLAADAERLAAGGLDVAAAGTTAKLPADTIRGWLSSKVTDQGLKLVVDAKKAPEALGELLPDAGKKPVNAGFTVSGGSVSITPAASGTKCCAPEAATVVENALLNHAQGDAPVELPLRTVEADRSEDEARKLGVVEQVASFTTNHAPGEPRVQNIHRMADIVRGAVIEPGGTFSLNGYVGPRTIEKGFVAAPFIDADMKFGQDVGGGVSQFSTTLFNASFFAGLDIISYGMHGLYISRYPYGREATLNYPGLDLKVRNSTPYGVLIWPSYTGSSITVTLYSTKTVSGEQTNQTKEEVPSAAPDGKPPCTRVVTERTRTYTDGHKTVDTFRALYSPKEGIKCR
jgi:vancomycin resistance protein YoaR